MTLSGSMEEHLADSLKLDLTHEFLFSPNNVSIPSRHLPQRAANHVVVTVFAPAATVHSHPSLRKRAVPSLEKDVPSERVRRTLGPVSYSSEFLRSR